MMHCLRNRGPKLGGHLPDIDKLVLLWVHQFFPLMPFFLLRLLYAIHSQQSETGCWLSVYFICKWYLVRVVFDLLLHDLHSVLEKIQQFYLEDKFSFFHVHYYSIGHCMHSWDRTMIDQHILKIVFIPQWNLNCPNLSSLW